MLVEFSVTNFRSIKERQTLHFASETRLSKNEHSENLINSLPAIYKTQLLKMLCIYGANASGKSNLLQALGLLKKLITEPRRMNDSLNYQPFGLDKQAMNAPTVLELIFVAKNQLKYEYHIEFKSDIVLYEALFFYPYEGRVRSPKAKLYEVERRQEKASFSFGSFYRGERFSERNLYPNQTLLSKVGDSPVESLEPVYDYIDKILEVILDKGKKASELQKAILLASDFVKENLISLAKEADFGIKGLQIEKLKTDPKIKAALDQFDDRILNLLPKMTPIENPTEEKLFEIRKSMAEMGLDSTFYQELREKVFGYKVAFTREVYDGAQLAETKVVWGLGDESGGTLSFLWLAAQLLSAIELGKVLVIDEIEENLHSKLLPLLLGFFNTRHNNPHNAQLVVTAHDTSLLERDFLRLDQIVLVKKNQVGASKVYRVSDFEGGSKLEALERAYLLGRFGAVPVVARKENVFLKFAKPE